jgi:hypothetical protein
VIAVRRISPVALVLLTFATTALVTDASIRADVAPTGARCDPRVVYRSAATGSGGTIRLDDATGTWGLDRALTGMLGHTTAAADVDGDGWTDLFVGTFADRPAAEYRVRGAEGPAPDRLLLGGPDGFRIDDRFPGARGRSSGAAFADLDGDGRPDLVIARNVKRGAAEQPPSEVLRNVGNGRFERAAVLTEPGGARSVGLLDYDADGRTDLFVTEDRWTGGSSRLLRNVGDFEFTDVTKAAGLGADIVGMGVATADLDGDGTADLFVGGSNRIFFNRGDGRFREGDSDTFQWKTFGDEDDPAGVAAGDVNRDGRTDLVVGEHYGSTIDQRMRVPVRLYLNQGAGDDGMPRFDDVTARAGLPGLPTKSPHVEIADLDADGWPDIVTSAAATATTPVVFRNLGRTGTPEFDVVGSPGSTRYWPSGVVFDADRDGRLDVVLTDFDADRPTLVLRNTSDAGHWVGVETSVGARVELYRPSGTELLGATTVGGSTGYGSGGPAVAWFGVGPERSVDVRVTGPDFEVRRQVRTDRLLTCTATARG